MKHEASWSTLHMLVCYVSNDLQITNINKTSQSTYDKKDYSSHADNKLCCAINVKCRREYLLCSDSATHNEASAVLGWQIHTQIRTLHINIFTQTCSKQTYAHTVSLIHSYYCYTNFY